jgi:transcription-repair coupling factor (superfamily II helicase)
MAQRLVVYRKIAAARSEGELDEVLSEMRDRYGPAPDSVLNLGAYGRIRVMADRIGLESIERQGRTAVLKFREGGVSRVPEPQRILAVINRRRDVTLVPPSGLRLSLDGIRDPGSGTREQPGTGSRYPHVTSGTQDRRAPARTSSLSRIPGPGSRTPSPSWWAKRATAPVQSGFSKEELTKAGPEDPRAPGGLFERLGGLLADLAG